MRSPARRALAASILLVAAACASPPEKEMGQAQGAIDTARAAGAGEYAAEELKEADAALARARDSAQQGDYRQALSHALDARDRAQTAARQAADGKAKARGDAERVGAEAAAALESARVQLERAASARPQPRTLTQARQTLAAADASLQKAREALAAGRYVDARRAAAAVQRDVKIALAQLNPSETPRPGRRPR